MNSDTSRILKRSEFLETAGWGQAEIGWLQQDASTRRYARLVNASGQTAILMDAPRIEPPPCIPGMSEQERQIAGWNAQSRLAGSRVEAFILVAEYLKRIGLRPPDIYADNDESGFILLEDFGENRELARLIEQDPGRENALYTQAALVLAKLHQIEPPELIEHNGRVWPIQNFDAFALRANVDLFADWLPEYDQRVEISGAARAQWDAVRDDLISRADAFPRVFTLRDYHAENLIALPDGEIGLLDFQDAVAGWDAWDLAMLTQDARRHVSSDTARVALRAYLDHTGTSETALAERLAVIGTLNALRITGVFARLIKRDRKPKYAAFMARQQAMLVQALQHPVTADMASFVRRTAPFMFEVGL